MHLVDTIVYQGGTTHSELNWQHINNLLLKRTIPIQIPIIDGFNPQIFTKHVANLNKNNNSFL